MTAITTLRNTKELLEFSVNDLYIATIDDWTSIAFAASVGLLPNSRKCERCSKLMHLVSRQENIDKKRWICKISEGKKKHYCSTKSIRSGTFFEKSHLTIRSIVHIIYWWSLELPSNLIEPLCGVSAKCASDFCSMLTRECSKWYQNKNVEDTHMEEATKPEQFEKRFRVDANGSTFARIVDAIRTSFGIEQM